MNALLIHKLFPLNLYLHLIHPVPSRRAFELHKKFPFLSIRKEHRQRTSLHPQPQIGKLLIVKVLQDLDPLFTPAIVTHRASYNHQLPPPIPLEVPHRVQELHSLNKLKLLQVVKENKMLHPLGLYLPVVQRHVFAVLGY